MKQLLPVGSVVTLEGGDKRLMVYGILQSNPGEKTQYDYIACPYPEGYIGPMYTYLFNHEDVKKVEFTGFTDGEFESFRTKLAEVLDADSGES